MASRKRKLKITHSPIIGSRNVPNDKIRLFERAKNVALLKKKAPEQAPNVQDVEVDLSSTPESGSTPEISDFESEVEQFRREDESESLISDLFAESPDPMTATAGSSKELDMPTSKKSQTKKIEQEFKRPKETKKITERKILRNKQPISFSSSNKNLTPGETSNRPLTSSPISKFEELHFDLSEIPKPDNEVRSESSKPIFDPPNPADYPRCFLETIKRKPLPSKMRILETDAPLLRHLNELSKKKK